MEPTFEVGETVIIHGVMLPTQLHLNGEEAVIEALPGFYPETPELYKISCRDPVIDKSLPKFLKKKEPPRHSRECDRVVSWDDCAWNPHKAKEKA